MEGLEASWNSWSESEGEAARKALQDSCYELLCSILAERVIDSADLLEEYAQNSCSVYFAMPANSSELTASVYCGFEDPSTRYIYRNEGWSGYYLQTVTTNTRLHEHWKELIRSSQNLEEVKDAFYDTVVDFLNSGATIITRQEYNSIKK